MTLERAESNESQSTVITPRAARLIIKCQSKVDVFTPANTPHKDRIIVTVVITFLRIFHTVHYSWQRPWLASVLQEPC
jgi:hypothetical protein